VAVTERPDSRSASTDRAIGRRAARDLYSSGARPVLGCIRDTELRNVGERDADEKKKRLQLREGGGRRGRRGGGLGGGAGARGRGEASGGWRVTVCAGGRARAVAGRPDQGLGLNGCRATSTRTMSGGHQEPPWTVRLQGTSPGCRFPERRAFAKSVRFAQHAKASPVEAGPQVEHGPVRRRRKMLKTAAR